MVSVRSFTTVGRAGVIAPNTQCRWYSQQPGQPDYSQYYAQQQQAQYYPQAAYYPPPPQSTGPEIGTKERPLVVVSAPQPRTLASRLWLLLFLVIGVSASLNILDQVAWHMNEKSGSGGGGGGRFGSMMGSQEVKPVDLSEHTTLFADIQGCDEAKQELEEIVMFLKDPKKFQDLGGRLPRGALLVGPPGTGKTMLAKAIAKEAGVKFFYCSGSEFDEMFVGVGSRRVRELFSAAKAAKEPALIFIDEIDALGGKRSSHDQSYSRMTLNQLLAEMDGFQSSDSIIVLGATNTPDSLDKALTRPGRFDTTVAVDPPDMKGRAAIVETYLKKIKKDETVSAMEIARGTSGFTGAELSNLINVAAIRAAVRGLTAVTAAEIDYATDRVLMGAESRSKVVPEEEKRITAYHEGGHALTALLLQQEGAEPVHKATIVPRGSGVMGLVQQQPKHDKYSQSKRQLEARLKVCLAGRIAEEILLGEEDVTTGALSDFQQATNMARTMVRRFGFNTSLGTIDYDTASTQEGAYLSDVTKEKIETEVRTIMERTYRETKDMLESHREKLDAIAQNLLKHETLSGDQLTALIDGKEMQTKAGATLAKADIVPTEPARPTRVPRSPKVTSHPHPTA